MPVHVFPPCRKSTAPAGNVLDRLRDGTARRIVKPGQVFSRVHVEDVAAALRASIARPRAGRGLQRRRRRTFLAARRRSFSPQVLLGIAPPPEEPFETAELSALARSFYAECRRVRNDRIKRELGAVLRYPTFREGLRSLAAP